MSYLYTRPELTPELVSLLGDKALQTKESVLDKYAPSTQVIVNEAADLVNIDSTKVYLINGPINMGTTQIEVPATGFYYYGLSYFNAFLYSDAPNYTMFVNKPGEAAGYVRGINVSHYLIEPTSQLFNLDNQGNFGAFEFEFCNLGDFGVPATNLGSVSNYRQFRLKGCGVFNLLDGLTFNGTWSNGFAIDDTIFLSIGAGITVFKEGTGLVFNGSSKGELNAFGINNSAIMFDFQDANFTQDQGFALNGARFNPLSSPIPNITNSSTKKYFKNCVGIMNTFPSSRWKNALQQATLLTQNVAAKILGTTSYVNEIHFNSTNNNEIVYVSTVQKEFDINSSNFKISGAAGDEIEIEIRQWDSSASTYVILESFRSTIINSSGLDVAVFNMYATAELDINDRVELWAINLTSSSSITMLIDSSLRVTERY